MSINKKIIDSHFNKGIPYPLVDCLVGAWVPGIDEEDSRNKTAIAWSIIAQKQAANEEFRTRESN